MIITPCKYASAIKQIIEWHLGAYVPDPLFDTRLERILEQFYERNLVDGKVCIEEKELYYLYECISNATNNTPECGVEKDLVWEIYDWIRDQYSKSKE